jgi:hypothetical protein
MSEQEDQRTKAPTENGSYNPEKAKRASETAVSQYVGGLKKTERIVWIYLVACVAVAAFSLDTFMFAASNKVMIGCGIAFLVAIETTILIKLWYWVVNTKLTLQKEIRQWKIQGSIPESAAYAPGWLAEMSFGRPGLSPWERRAWFAGLLVVAIAAGIYPSYSALTAPNPRTLSQTIKLAPDGTSSSTTDFYSRPRAGAYADSFSFYTGLKGTVRWLDERGRQLPFDLSTEGDQRRYTVYFLEPVSAGEWLRYTEIQEIPSAATHEGDLWTYTNGHTFGDPKNRLFVTVQLPRGAKLVSVDPEPVEQSTVGETTRVMYHAEPGANEPFRYEIQYRLADKAAAKGSAP